jgi:chromosome segregation ATPase
MEAPLLDLTRIISALAASIAKGGVLQSVAGLKSQGHPDLRQLLADDTEMLLQTNSTLTADLKKAGDLLAGHERNIRLLQSEKEQLTEKIKDLTSALTDAKCASHNKLTAEISTAKGMVADQEKDIRLLRSEKYELTEKIKLMDNNVSCFRSTAADLENLLSSLTESGKRRESELLNKLKEMQTKAETFENELIGLRKAQENPIEQLLQSNVVQSVISQRDEVLQLRTTNTELARMVKILEAKVASYESQDAELAKKLENA